MAYNLHFKGPPVFVLKWTYNCPLGRRVALPPAVPWATSLRIQRPSAHAHCGRFTSTQLLRKVLELPVTCRIEFALQMVVKVKPQTLC